ncbi:MAG: nucleoside-diphosphate sugar epimerase, partial [Candidatus Marinimicrobia bacterium]|nr:nucleoside-diphosphate sugar epimerase [Candidatus Neomarinimicrobiota bacterium]
MLKRIIYLFLSKSPIYVRRIILLFVDIFLISASLNIGLLVTGEQFNLNFYIPLILISILIYLFTGQYKSITRYLDDKSLLLLSLRTLGSLFLLSVLSKLFNFSLKENLIYLWLWIFISLSITFARVIFKDLVFFFKSIDFKYTKVAIYGAGEAGNQLLASLKLDRRFNVVYFFDDSEILQNRFINGIEIKNPKHIANYVKNFEQLFIAIPSLNKHKMKLLLNSLAELNIPVLQIPSVEEISSGKASISSLKPISIENILGRDPITPNLDLLKSEIEGKVICVTGAGGSIGSEICRQIIRLAPSYLLMIDISEYALYKIQQDLIDINPNIKMYSLLGNLLDKNFLDHLFEKFDINIIFHAAAYKHVPLVEENPFQGIKNNVFSTLNLCKVAQKYRTEHLLLISSDKAVRPTNFMGASKRIAELIFQAFSNKEN